MKFRNKKSNETIDVKKKVLINAYTHNSNWEVVEEIKNTRRGGIEDEIQK